jgi:cell division protein FtsZ
MSINLQLPKLTDLRPRITVIGVGGAGGNAVNNMIASGLGGVDFIVANTDAQALATSSAERRIQLGVNLTEGLGAGSKPEIGQAAAEEALDDIRSQIVGSHMVFIAAGMGGGTGTGAAAVIARTARELGILTVGVVTKPFQFEGARRMRAAEAGILELKKHVDTLIVIPNQNLFRVANEKTTFAEAFVLADQVLYSGIACIVDLIVKEGLINLDFADVRTVMSGMGSAMMGTGEATGERRAIRAAEEAIANPLLDEVSLKGAKGLLTRLRAGSARGRSRGEHHCRRIIRRQHGRPHPGRHRRVGDAAASDGRAARRSRDEPRFRTSAAGGPQSRRGGSAAWLGADRAAVSQPAAAATASHDRSGDACPKCRSGLASAYPAITRTLACSGRDRHRGAVAIAGAARRASRVVA